MRNLRTLLLLVVAMLLIIPAVNAQDEKEAMSKEDQEKMSREYGELMTPGEHHARLDYFVGEWNASTRMWMNGLDEEPTVGKGTFTYEWIYDGRFLNEKIEGEGMEPGERYHEVSYLGYNTFRKQYVMGGVSNMSTGIYRVTGVYDPDANAYVFYGESDEPMTGEIARASKIVYKIKDENTFVIEMHDLSRGLENTKTMGATCTRKTD